MSTVLPYKAWLIIILSFVYELCLELNNLSFKCEKNEDGEGGTGRAGESVGGGEGGGGSSEPYTMVNVAKNMVREAKSV